VLALFLLDRCVAIVMIRGVLFGKERAREGDRPGPLDSVVDLQCIGETQGSFCGLQNGRLRKW
jgi:hypothetical protein